MEGRSTAEATRRLPRDLWGKSGVFKGVLGNVAGGTSRLTGLWCGVLSSRSGLLLNSWSSNAGANHLQHEGGKYTAYILEARRLQFSFPCSCKHCVYSSDQCYYPLLLLLNICKLSYFGGCRCLNLKAFHFLLSWVQSGPFPFLGTHSDACLFIPIILMERPSMVASTLAVVLELALKKFHPMPPCATLKSTDQGKLFHKTWFTSTLKFSTSPSSLRSFHPR